jgi:hypothetical protein
LPLIIAGSFFRSQPQHDPLRRTIFCQRSRLPTPTLECEPAIAFFRASPEAAWHHSPSCEREAGNGETCSGKIMLRKNARAPGGMTAGARA